MYGIYRGTQNLYQNFCQRDAKLLPILAPVYAPQILITIHMVKKAISKMKSGKMAGLSVEMIRAAGITGATMV